MPRKSTLRRVLEAIRDEWGQDGLGRIADGLDLSRRRANADMINDICRELGNDLRRLVCRTGPLGCADWNDFLNTVGLPPRKSYEEILGELNKHFDSDPQHGKNASASNGDDRDNRHATSKSCQGIIQHDGAWTLIERVLRQSRSRSDLIWITFNFAAPPRLLTFLADGGFRARVLCRHPRSGVALNRSSFDAWRCKGLGPLYGLRVREGEDEEEVPGALHGKAIAVRDGNRFRGVVGSFNLAHGSLFSNTETAIALNERDAETLWLEAEALLGSPFVSEVTEEDCTTDSGAPPAKLLGSDVKLENVPALASDRWTEITSGRRPPEVLDPARLPPDPRYRPEALGYLKLALDNLLLEWPAVGHPKQGWQRETYEKLWKRMDGATAEVLYLPVGVGKTYIALRWLLEHFEQTTVGRKQRGVFLAPNEWIARSVANDIERVVESAERLLQHKRTGCTSGDVRAMADQCLHVLRPSELARCKPADVVALVADECHNWSPDGARSADGYKALIDKFRKRKTRILGLTATPCRMDQGRFDVKAFLSSFRQPTRDDYRPLMHLASAIKGKLLAPFDSKVLLSGQPHDKVIKVLGGPDAAVSMGDYHLVVLREVWGVLMQNQKALLDEIDAGLAHSRRALVFMPPVGDEGDSFVRKLGQRVGARGGQFFDFRDRAESDESAREQFQHFRDTDVKLGRPAVLVTVNRFSEGVSINDIDTLIMLRATLSPRVAVQALGRGLRLDPDNPEKRCRVFDAVEFTTLLGRWDKVLNDN